MSPGKMEPKSFIHFKYCLRNDSCAYTCVPRSHREGKGGAHITLAPTKLPAVLSAFSECCSTVTVIILSHIRTRAPSQALSTSHHLSSPSQQSCEVGSVISLFKEKETEAQKAYS